MQIISIGDHLWEIPKPVFLEKYEVVVAICMKCQILFSGGNKKTISMSSAENITQSAQS